MESSRSGKPEDIQSSAHEEKKTEQVESIPPVAEEELSEADRLLWEKLFNDSISAELFAHRDIILSNFSETARDKAFHETEEILNKFIVKLIRIRKEAAGKDKETQEAVALCKKASAFLEKVYFVFELFLTGAPFKGKYKHERHESFMYQIGYDRYSIADYRLIAELKNEIKELLIEFSTGQIKNFDYLQFIFCDFIFNQCELANTKGASYANAFFSERFKKNIKVVAEKFQPLYMLQENPAYYLCKTMPAGQMETYKKCLFQESTFAEAKNEYTKWLFHEFYHDYKLHRKKDKLSKTTTIDTLGFDFLQRDILQCCPAVKDVVLPKNLQQKSDVHINQTLAYMGEIIPGWYSQVLADLIIELQKMSGDKLSDNAKLVCVNLCKMLVRSGEKGKKICVQLFPESKSADKDEKKSTPKTKESTFDTCFSRNSEELTKLCLVIEDYFRDSLHQVIRTVQDEASGEVKRTHVSSPADNLPYYLLQVHPPYKLPAEGLLAELMKTPVREILRDEKEMVFPNSFADLQSVLQKKIFRKEFDEEAQSAKKIYIQLLFILFLNYFKNPQRSERLFTAPLVSADRLRLQAEILLFCPAISQIVLPAFLEQEKDAQLNRILAFLPTIRPAIYKDILADIAVDLSVALAKKEPKAITADLKENLFQQFRVLIRLGQEGRRIYSQLFSPGKESKDEQPITDAMIKSELKNMAKLQKLWSVLEPMLLKKFKIRIYEGQVFDDVTLLSERGQMPKFL